MSRIRALWLRPDLYADLLRLTGSTIPDEACGALIGSVSEGIARVSAIIPMRNVAADPRTSYRLDDAHLARLHLTAAHDPEQAIIAYWHSHPRGTADPSVEDVRLASYADIPYLILGHRSESVTAAAWHLEAGSAEPIPLIISDTAPPSIRAANGTAERLWLIGTALVAALMVIAAAVALLPPAPEIPR
jgi:desampylase